MVWRCCTECPLWQEEFGETSNPNNLIVDLQPSFVRELDTSTVPFTETGVKHSIDAFVNYMCFIPSPVRALLLGDVSLFGLDLFQIYSEKKNCWTMYSQGPPTPFMGKWRTLSQESTTSLISEGEENHVKRKKLTWLQPLFFAGEIYETLIHRLFIQDTR